MALEQGGTPAKRKNRVTDANTTASDEQTDEHVRKQAERTAAREMRDAAKVLGIGVAAVRYFLWENSGNNKK